MDCRVTLEPSRRPSEGVVHRWSHTSPATQGEDRHRLGHIDGEVEHCERGHCRNRYRTGTRLPAARVTTWLQTLDRTPAVAPAEVRLAGHRPCHNPDRWRAQSSNRAEVELVVYSASLNDGLSFATTLEGPNGVATVPQWLVIAFPATAVVSFVARSSSLPFRIRSASRVVTG